MSDPWISGFGRRGVPRDRCPRVRAPVYPEPILCALLSEQLWQRLLHYDSVIKRTVPCSMDDDCPYCPGNTLRPVGYLAACEGLRKRPIILQLSDSALTTLEALYSTYRHLRGLVVQTSRADKRPNARMELSFVSQVAGDTLPPDFDPRPTLERMWGWSLRGLAPFPLLLSDPPTDDIPGD